MIEKLFAAIKAYKLIYLAFIMLAGALIGYLIMGPFVTSGIIDWVKGQPKIVIELLDVGSMISNALVSASVPMFIVWAIAFYSYQKMKENLGALNKAYPLAYLFAESPASLILFLSSTLIGICLYGWFNYVHSSSLKALSVLSVFFVILGFIVRYSCTPKLEKNKLLNKYSVVCGHVCVLFAVIAYLWSIAADPIQSYLIVKEYAKIG